MPGPPLLVYIAGGGRTPAGGILSKRQESAVNHPGKEAPDRDANARRRQEYERALGKIGREIRLAKGESLLTDHIYYLLEGICVLLHFGPLGEETSLLYFEEGRMLNFLPKLSRVYPMQPKTLRRKQPRDTFAVRAKTDCRLLRIDQDVFVRELGRSAGLHVLLEQSLAENCLNLLARAGNSPLLPVPQRICRLLAELMPSTPPYRLPRYMSYAEMALHLAIHPVTVAKIFKALKAEGIAWRDGGSVCVFNPERLRRIASGEEDLPYKRHEAGS